MTINELAMNWIEHADTTPEEITLDDATYYVGLLRADDDEGKLPDDLTPETFRDAWNEIIRGCN